MKKYDLLIVGGGPGGYSLAVAAAKKGLTVALFEREHLGGTCLNIGCIPTKYLVDKAVAMEKVRSLVKEEIFRDAGSFSFRKIQTGKGAVTKKLVNGVSYLLKKNGVEVVNGQATVESADTVSCNGEEYNGRYLVLATGSIPMTIPIPGHEHCIDSTGALNLDRLPKSMVVMGGGVIGLELACAFAAYGTEITVIEMQPAIMPREEKAAVDLLLREITKRGIRILTGAKMLRVEKEAASLCAVYEQNGKEERLPAQQILMAAGRRPRMTGIDAEKLGLALSKTGCIQVDEHQLTNLPCVYAIGDVAGGYQLAHAAYAEGEIVLAHILGEGEVRRPPIPVCTYSIPCYASVGLTTEAAAAAGFEPAIGSFSYEANGMALAEGAHGAVFVVMDKVTRRTLGVSIVGENASEMIAFATVAVDKGTTLEEWKSMVVAHPSLCEMVREAALDAFHEAVHKG